LPSARVMHQQADLVAGGFFTLQSTRPSSCSDCAVTAAHKQFAGPAFECICSGDECAYIQSILDESLICDHKARILSYRLMTSSTGLCFILFRPNKVYSQVNTSKVRGVS
jgi:hypothetical protein